MESQDSCLQNDAQVLVVPYPMQGHVTPMMTLSERIASFGINVTFIATEHYYKELVSGVNHSQVRLVAVPDGLEAGDDRKDMAKLAVSISKVMPDLVYNQIVKAKHQPESNCKVTCLIADVMFHWAHDIADKTGIKLAMFWTSSPGTLAVALKIPELIQNGTIDQEGTALKKDDIQLLSNMPCMRIQELPWYDPDNLADQNIRFRYFCAVEQAANQARWLLCNWFDELNLSASNSIPNLVPVGPLLANRILKPKDSACLAWLDGQPSRSVIYVAFGSISTLTQNQLDELAFGIELSQHRFLWVVRAGQTGNSPVRFPDGFEERVASYGRIVEWAPQDQVLAHPSVICFLTHCGWNSTMEGIGNGVPMLCWPCFADQPYTRTCISEAWKIGISLNPDEQTGIILRDEIKSNIDKLLSHADVAENSIKLKESAKRSVDEGRSFAAMQGFVEQIQS